MSDAKLLELRGFGVAFGDRVVLADVTLDVPRTGLLVLMGPAGAGKSTLLRTLAGLNDAHPALTTWGSVALRGRPLLEHRLASPADGRREIGLVMQHARFYLATVRENLVSALPNRASLDHATQTARACQLLAGLGLSDVIDRFDEDVCALPTAVQRRIAIARALVPEPDVVMVDEPTAGLDDEDAVNIVALLCAQAAQRAVLFVTHNQRLARASRGQVVFLAGGRVLETAPAAKFFLEPQTEEARQFIRSGNCHTSSPDAQPEQLDATRPPPPTLPAAAIQARSRFEGPRGFFWVVPGRLGGVPRPGIVDELDRDLEGLQRLGVTTLIALEESLTVSAAALERFGIALLHFPIVDMGAPALGAGAALAREIERRMGAGQVIAVHCRAGLGRTGTTLAAQLVYRGESAREAIERVRRIKPQCIQSHPQVQFLSELESFLRRDPIRISQS